MTETAVVIDEAAGGRVLRVTGDLVVARLASIERSLPRFPGSGPVVLDLAGVDAMLEGLDLVKAGIIIKHDQRLDNGSYESWFKKKATAIDWAEHAGHKDIADMLRAAEAE